MNYIKNKNNKFVYVNDEKEKLLLDYTNYILNKTNTPLCLIPDFLVELQCKYNSLFLNGCAPLDQEDSLLIDILLVAQLIETSHPIKLAEFGATNGQLSYHLASILGKFNKHSTLCSICDCIGNESENIWIDMISLVETSSKVSLIASDYDETSLCTGHFDIVVLNGSVSLGNPDTVTREALRLLKTNGSLICYAWQQPYLANCVRKHFSTIDEYPTSADTTILVAKGMNAIDPSSMINIWRENAENDIICAEIALAHIFDKTTLFQHAKTLNHHADVATANNVLDIKLKCIKIKEALLKKYIDL